MTTAPATIIADNCALIANAVFTGNLGTPNLVTLLLGVVAFAWQIYGDFSGYSCIARGSAQLLGFHFDVNFRQPYLAQSLQDFWRRWHISLSTWLRDYLYVPLGGNRLGTARTYLNLMLTMLLGGLWHGANWTFVVWGGIHGAGLAVERLAAGKNEIRDSANALARLCRRVCVFGIVCFAWVFFRSRNVGEAWTWLTGAGSWRWQPEYGIAAVFLGTYALLLFLVDIRNDSAKEEYFLESQPAYQRLITGLALCAMTTLIGANARMPSSTFSFRQLSSRRASVLPCRSWQCAHFAALEMASRLVVPLASQGAKRVQNDYQSAVELEAKTPGLRETVLIAGNSLLLLGIDRQGLTSAMADEYSVVLFPIENTVGLDWYFGLRRLFAEGSRPSVVVLCLTPRQLASKATNGEHFAHFMMRTSDLMLVRALGELDNTTTSSYFFANLSDWLGSRAGIRNWVLEEVFPGFEGLANQLAPRAPPTRDDSALMDGALARLKQLSDLCKTNGARFVLQYSIASRVPIR
jgi:hypothetical protein